MPAAAAMLVIVTALQFHELDVTAQANTGAVVIRAAYAGTDPVPFAKVQVFNARGEEWQSANTDKRGYFSFVPDTPGDWRVVVDDELGHKREIHIASDGNSATQAPPARTERALLGISLIVGITGFWYGYKSRSQMRP